MANEIAEIAARLQAAGLTVATPWGPYLGWVDLVIFFQVNEAPTSPITTYSGRCMIVRQSDQWCLKVDNWLAGPGPDGLEYCVATPAAIVALTIRYVLGKPLLIEGWQVPTHQHPEWTDQPLHQAIAHAQPLTASAWEQIQQDAREHYNQLVHANHPHLTNHPRSISQDEWYACIFVRIQHENPTNGETLWLRRDLVVAYRITQKSRPASSA